MQRSSFSEFDDDAVTLMWQRAFSACESCGRGLDRSQRGRQWSAHHRKPRGMGGSGDARLGEPSNGLILCGTGTTGCHGKFESKRARAIELGVIIDGDHNPADVPVWLYQFGMVLLRDDGTLGEP